MSSTYRNNNNPFLRFTNKHSQVGTFSQPCSNRAFSNCLSDKEKHRTIVSNVQCAFVSELDGDVEVSCHYEKRC